MTYSEGKGRESERGFKGSFLTGSSSNSVHASSSSRPSASRVPNSPLCANMEDITKFIDFAGCSREVATEQLKYADGDYDLAIRRFFNDPNS
jgi:hypothetical protein